MILFKEIKDLADKYANQLSKQIKDRQTEMQNDNLSHHLIYQVLGISVQEGINIDEYQNKGRFLYKYAGSFLEEAAFLCIKYKYNDAEKTRIPNTAGQRPKTFEIDALVNKDKYAIEIKWRDATTDGDHITKEHTRAKVICHAGYIPVRIMFYYPNRLQAQKVQEALRTLYIGLNGYYYDGDSAWQFIYEYTGVNLLKILERIADERKLTY